MPKLKYTLAEVQTAAMLAATDLEAFDDAQLIDIAQKLFEPGSWQRRALRERLPDADPIISVEKRTEIPGPDGKTPWPVAIILVHRPAAGVITAKISRSVLWNDMNGRWRLL